MTSRELEADINKAESKLSKAVHEESSKAEKAAKDTKNKAQEKASDAKASFPSVDEVKRDVNDLVSKKPLKEHQKKNLLKAGGAVLAAIAGVVLVTATVKKIKHKDDPEPRGWFGARKKEVENVASDVKAKLHKATESTGDKLGGARKTAAAKAEEAAASSREAAEKLKKEAQKSRDKAESTGAKASHKSENVVQKAAHTVTSGAKSAGHTVTGAASGAVHKTKDAAGTVTHKGGDFFGDLKGWLAQRKAEFADSAAKGKQKQAQLLGH